MTRRGLFGLLVAAPLSKLFPKKLLTTPTDVIGAAVQYNRPYVVSSLTHLADVYYKKKGLERLRKKFVFHEFIKESTGQTILFDRKPVPTQATFDFYDDFIDDSSDDDWGEYD